MLQKPAKPLAYHTICILIWAKCQVRQLLVELLYFLEDDPCRCHALIQDTQRHTSEFCETQTTQKGNGTMSSCQHLNSTRPLVLGLPVLNGQVLNSMAVFKAHTFLCHTKTLQLRLLLCCWHGVEACCHSLGLHLSSKHRVADVMPTNHLLTLQMEVLWAYVWKMHQIWYHSHQGNFSLDSPLEALSVHTLAKPLYLWLQWFTPTFP